MCNISGDVKQTKYCTVKLDEEKYKNFIYAVKNHYWYQMYIDDLPIWGKLPLLCPPSKNRGYIVLLMSVGRPNGFR